MDFELTFSQELEDFRKEVGTWLDANAPKLTHSSEPRDYTDDDWTARKGLRNALGQKGWLYATATPQYGGGGLTTEHAIIIHQELEKREIYGLTEGGGSMGAACILVWGNDEQKERFVRPILTGEVDAWQLLTEPQGGSDLASAKTMALRDGDDYVVNGQKIFVGNNHHVDYLWTIVNTDPQGPRHRNLSYLMIPADSPGITYQPLYLLSSATTSESPYIHKNIIFFDDVRVPAANLVGGHNEGWKVSGTHMEMEHGGGGNVSRELMLERLLETLNVLEQDGKRLIDDPDTRDQLSEVLVERNIRRLFGLRNYWTRHSHGELGHFGPQSTYWGKSRAHSFPKAALGMLGFYSINRDPKYVMAKGYLELLNRNVFIHVHAGGGLNIQATIMARRLGIGRNTREEAGRLPD